MYAEREYERVQLVGLIDDVAMNEPHVCPLYASGLSWIPSADSVGTQAPVTGTMLESPVSRHIETEKKGRSLLTSPGKCYTQVRLSHGSMRYTR